MPTRQHTGAKPVNISTRLPPELAERVRQAAFLAGISQSLFIVQAIEAAIPDPYANILDDYHELGRRHRARISSDGGPSIELTISAETGYEDMMPERATLMDSLAYSPLLEQSANLDYRAYLEAELKRRAVAAGKEQAPEHAATMAIGRAHFWIVPRGNLKALCSKIILVWGDRVARQIALLNQ